MMEYIIGVVAAFSAVLAFLLRHETLKRAETEAELVATQQEAKHYKEATKGLVDRNKVKDKYIVELEKRVIESKSGDELAGALNRLFPDPEDDNNAGPVSN